VSTVSIQGSLCVRDTGSCGDTPGEIYTTGGNVASIDLAENYPTLDETIEAGDIVALSSSTLTYLLNDGAESSETIGAIAKAKKGDRLLGAISTKPGMLFGYDIQDVPVRPVALSGRIPVKVSIENGAIEIGDFITSGSVSGVGVKAVESGNVIGVALEKFDNATPGKIIVFAELGYETIESGNFLTNALALSTGVFAEAINTVSEWVGDSIRAVSAVFEKITAAVANFGEVVTKSLSSEVIYTKEITAGTVTTDKLCLQDVCITKDELGSLLRNFGTTAVPPTPTIPSDDVSSTSPFGSSSEEIALTITLMGNNPAELSLGSEFVDPGATALDSAGNSLIPDIFENTVNTDTEGEYHVIWRVHDGQMNWATSTRTVIVKNPFAGISTSTSSQTDAIPVATSTEEIVSPVGTSTVSN